MSYAINCNDGIIKFYLWTRKEESGLSEGRTCVSAFAWLAGRGKQLQLSIPGSGLEIWSSRSITKSLQVKLVAGFLETLPGLRIRALTHYLPKPDISTYLRVLRHMFICYSSVKALWGCTNIREIFHVLKAKARHHEDILESLQCFTYNFTLHGDERSDSRSVRFIPSK
jgi:hypothetical protein